MGSLPRIIGNIIFTVKGQIKRWEFIRFGAPL